MENLRFPAGFRFHPSDEELIVHYLQSQATSRPLPASIIAEIDLYKYNPWELPKKALFGEGEWYFFSPRDRKYPKGERPNRAAGLGYWKATGIDKPIFSSSGLSKPIGVKKGLAFYAGRPPKGEKTDWFMNEYRLLDSSAKPPGQEGSMRLDNWVLCRIRYRGTISKSTHETPASHSLQVLKPLPITKQRIDTIVNPDSLEVFEQSPKPERRIHTTVNPDIITDYLHKGCVLLAFILSSGQAVLPRETIPRANYPEATRNDRNLNSFYENSFDTSHLLLPTDNCNLNLKNGEFSETETLAVIDPMDLFVGFGGLEELDITVNTRDTRAAYPK